MKIYEFMEEIEKNWGKHFPESKINVWQWLKTNNHLRINCYLVKNESESINRIIQNDMLRISFFIDEIIIDKNNPFSNINESISLESTLNSYFIKPQKKNLVYSIKQLKFRKTTGNPEKIIKKLDDFFSYLKQDLKESLANDLIHENHIELLKSKLLLS